MHDFNDKSGKKKPVGQRGILSVRMFNAHSRKRHEGPQLPRKASNDTRYFPERAGKPPGCHTEDSRKEGAERQLTPFEDWQKWYTECLTRPLTGVEHEAMKKFHEIIQEANGSTQKIKTIVNERGLRPPAKQPSAEDSAYTFQ